LEAIIEITEIIVSAGLGTFFKVVKVITEAYFGIFIVKS
jgi:hypothetical protein